MVHLDLFSGITGFALAASWVWGEDYKIHSFVEIDPFCQKVIKKHWPDVPIHGDIKTYEHDGTKIDLLTGGFPCQPFSVAGKQRGKEDDRALWPEMLRIIKEAKPRWIIGENVTGIVNMELNNYVSDLEAEGYEVQPFIIPACAVDAPHRRDRVWIVGHTSSGRCDTGGNNKQGGYFCKTEIGATTENQQTGYGRELRFSERSSSQNVADPTSGAIWNGRTSKRVENEGWGTTETKRKAVRSGEKAPFGSDSGQGGEDVADTTICMSPESRGTRSRGAEFSNRSNSPAGWHNSNNWFPEPEFCRIFNELSEGLDKNRLTKPESHDMMGLNFKKGDKNASSKNTRPGKILQGLRKENIQKTVQRNIGGHDNLQEKEILQPSLYGSRDDIGRTDSCSIEEKSSCVQGGCMRILWHNGKFEYPPYGFQHSKQRKIKSEDTMLFLSYVMALDSRQTQGFVHEQAETLYRLRQGIAEIKTWNVPKTLPEIQEIWRSLSNKEADWLILRISTGNPFCSEWPGTPRVATGVKDRVNKLKALGNAIVPQTVVPIMEAIKEIDHAKRHTANSRHFR